MSLAAILHGKRFDVLDKSELSLRDMVLTATCLRRISCRIETRKRLENRSQSVTGRSTTT